MYYVSYKHKRKTKAPKWYDAECRAKRALAIEAGERVTIHSDKQKQTAACRAYQSCKQRKEHAFIKTCVHDINSAFFNDRGNLWRVIDNVRNNKGCVTNTEPSDSEFYQYFKDLSTSQLPDNCNVNYERVWQKCLNILW